MRAACVWRRVEKRRIGASKRGVSSDVIAYEGRSFDVGDALFDEKEKKKGALFFGRLVRGSQSCNRRRRACGVRRGKKIRGDTYLLE